MEDISDYKDFEKQQKEFDSSIEKYKKTMMIELSKIPKEELLQTKIIKKSLKYRVMYFLSYIWYRITRKKR